MRNLSAIHRSLTRLIMLVTRWTCLRFNHGVSARSSVVLLEGHAWLHHQALQIRSLSASMFLMHGMSTRLEEVQSTSCLMDTQDVLPYHRLMILR